MIEAQQDSQIMKSRITLGSHQGKKTLFVPFALIYIGFVSSLNICFQTRLAKSTSNIILLNYILALSLGCLCMIQLTDLCILNT